MKVDYINSPTENVIVFILFGCIFGIAIYLIYKLRHNIVNKFNTEFFTYNNYDIYYINLTRRKDRNETILAEFKKTQLLKDCNRLEAVDGKNINLDKYRKFNVDSLEKKRGWIGCAESHIALWDKCIELNKNILAFEDDTIIKDEYDNNMRISLNNLPDDFDIIYYHTVNYAKYIPFNDFYFKLIGNNYSTVNYLISPQGARKLLESIKPYNPSRQIDSYIVNMTESNKLNAYIFKLPTIYTVQDYNESDAQIKKNKYIVHDFHKNLLNNK
jgi:GR25 family glycosyltransferase involved in LPS biosynthesis